MPNHSSYSVVSTDFDGALFNMNAAVSRAYPQNNSSKSVRDIIDRTISYKVWLRRSDTPLRYGVPGGMSCENIPLVLIKGQTHNSNIRLRDQIVETLFSCYDDSQLHSEIL